MDEMECPGKRNFLDLGQEYSSIATSRFQVVPVPFDGTSTYIAGSRFGPRAIIDASANLELYDHELDMEPAEAGIATHAEVAVAVDPAQVQANIEKVVESVLSAGKTPVVLGGEHTVGLASIKALSRRHDFMVVSLDAHADLRDSYQGSPLSHACFLRRASELAACCAFGVRSLSKEEAEHAKRAGIRLVFADRMAGGGRKDIDLSFIPDQIYLSIDLDVLDPSLMPATGTPEPGGLDWYAVMGLLRRIVDGRTVLGFDVVELCPQPGNPAPDFLAAKLVYRLMGLIVGRTNNGKEKVEEAARCGGKGRAKAD